MIGSDRIVFINFIPGSFGSFLLHTLSYSPSVFLKNKKDIYFDETGAAHHNIKQYLENFHDGLFVKNWIDMPSDTKIEQLEQSWKPPQKFIDSNLYHIHRLVVPNYTPIFKKYIPAAKYIKITVPDHYLPLVESMIRKKMIDNNYPVYVKDLQSNDIIDGVYNFDISHFIEGTFLNEFDKLCEWLNFEKVDVSKQYERFKQVNGLDKC